MSKKAKYTIVAAAAGGIVNGLINIVNQNNENPNHQIDWSLILKAALRGAVICGTGGLIVGAYVDHQNNLEKPLNTDMLLLSLVKNLKLDQHDKKYVALCEKADWLISKIKQEFYESLKGEPFRFGSTEDGTALREKYDVDVSISFKSNSFATIKDMYQILEDYLRTLEGKNGMIMVRQQTVSIGVFFDLGHGREGKVDVVPVKITRRKGNSTSGYLHKNPSSLFSTHSYQKTDTYLLSKGKLSNTQKEILVALKKWKRKENVPISSHLLQNLIKDAYSCNINRIPLGLTKKVIMVITHICTYIESIHLTSIENSNNILTDIPDADKITIRSAGKRVIDDFKYQPNSIISYFS